VTTPAAIYARFSSDLQDERSLGDQVAACRVYCERAGMRVAAVHTDAAMSGASMVGRAGLAALLDDAKTGRIRTVVTESLDRLSRDLSDLAGIHKRLVFAGVEIVTLADGAVSDIHVGVKGLVASLFLKDLAAKTKRGHVGRLNAGMVPGGKLYGYDAVPGEPGVRRINPDEAAVVRRIFLEYASGRSPRKIVRDLNAERIPAPRGGFWNHSTITGSRARQNGIIQSRLYVGDIVYNRERMVKDPATGRRVHLVNPPAEWLTHAAPHLAIVEPGLFARAQRVRENMKGPNLGAARRPRHLFSGRMVCGCCGHQMIVVREDEVECSGYRNKAVCPSRARVRVGEVEARVLGAVAAELLAPDAIAAATAAYRAERDRLKGEADRSHRDGARRLAALDVKIGRLVSAIEEGGDVPALMARLRALEAERADLARSSAPAMSNKVLALYANAAERYRAKVSGLAAALRADDPATTEARSLVRDLVERLTVTPAGRGTPPQILIEGNLAALMSAHPGGDIGGSGTRLQAVTPAVWRFRLAA
jgi:site-specific DNA recombinase